MNLQEFKQKYFTNKFNLNENKPQEIKYRIVSDYGYGDKSWVERDLTKDEVKEYFVKYRGWSEQDFDEVGIEYFIDNDFTYYVEIDNIASAGEKALHKQNVMPRFVYRLSERGQVRTYEIGECDTPRTYPEGWCDRRVCEGFWGDEEMVKKVVALLNGA